MRLFINIVNYYKLKLCIICFQDFPGDYKCITNDASAKMSKMEITWHAKDDLPEVTQALELFSSINVEMHKGDDMIKIETRLIRPI